MIFLLIPLLCTAIWWVSLRRTPWSVFWGVIVGMIAGSGELGMVAVAHHAASHHVVNTVGELGEVTGVALFVALLAMCNEITSWDSTGAIHKWRKAHKSRHPLEETWKVVTIQSTGPHVEVFIQNGPTRRFIGRSDPVDDMDDFMDLTIRAKEATEQYNALKIGAMISDDH